ncbi:hemerythrin domain-containing protein [Pseudomonas aeruginosa]
MAVNIYEALHQSHEVQRSLCRRLVRATPDGGKREAILRELRIELAAHAAAEERYLYAPILMHDMGLNSSRHALAEHHEIDECIKALARADYEGGSWHAKAKQLSHEVHHHLKEEETKFFQVSGKILTEAQKSKLARLYLSDYERMKKKLAET